MPIKILIKNFNKVKHLIVLIGVISSNFSFAGSYEDFFKAIKLDDSRHVEQLLQRGFDPNTPSPNHQTGLFLALREGSFKVAQTLIQARGVGPNILTQDGESPLMIAALKGQDELARQLIDAGADVNKTGWTALHYAATGGHISLMKLLLERYAYIDAESPNKTTPLMMAARYGTADAVKLLLEEGADSSLKNDLGLTAIDFATQAQRQDSVNAIANFIRAQQPKGKW